MYIELLLLLVMHACKFIIYNQGKKLLVIYKGRCILLPITLQAFEQDYAQTLGLTKIDSLFYMVSAEY